MRNISYNIITDFVMYYQVFNKSYSNKDLRRKFLLFWVVLSVPSASSILNELSIPIIVVLVVQVLRVQVPLVIYVRHQDHPVKRQTECPE